MARSRASGRLAVEFIVIVAGVLCALAVDEWRESLEEQQFEVELIQSLILDVQLDSGDFASLPDRAIRRIQAAELLLQNLAPHTPRSRWVVPALDTLASVPNPAGDDELTAALLGLVLTSDLDVARGAYSEFSGGGQRLIQNPELRRAIHDYYYLVESLTKFDLLVSQSTDEMRRQTHRLGVGQGDNDALYIRDRLSGPAAEPFFAAVRTLQSDAWGQWDISKRLLTAASSLLVTLREEISSR